MYVVDLSEFINNWPFNLINELKFNDDKSIVSSVSIDSVYNALNTLGKQEQRIIDLRFKQNMTLKEIASQLHLSRERCRQVIQNAIEKLSNEYNKNKMSTISMEEYLHLKFINDQMSNDIKTLKNDNSKTSDDDNIVIRRLTIEKIGFSKRTYGALKRIGIRRLIELTFLTEKELKNIRNIGTISANEILSVLKQYNLELFNPKTDNTNSIKKLSIPLKAKIIMHDFGIDVIDELIRYTVDDLLSNGLIRPTEIDELNKSLYDLGFNLKYNDSFEDAGFNREEILLLNHHGIGSISDLLSCDNIDILHEINKNYNIKFSSIKYRMRRRGTPLAKEFYVCK